MSIIYAALRKIQLNRELVSVAPPRPSILATMGVIDKLIIACLLLLISYLGYHAIMQEKHPRVSSRPLTQVSAAAMPARQPTIRPVTKIPAVPLTLTGVMISAQESLALINHQPLHVGDRVAGLRIMTIALDKVELEQDGKIVTLRTSA